MEEFTIKKLSCEQLKSFIYKIDFYPNFYPTKFFDQFSELEINLEKSLNSFNLETSSISREQSEGFFFFFNDFDSRNHVQLTTKTLLEKKIYDMLSAEFFLSILLLVHLQKHTIEAF
ncbi:hypothetical protein BpHYR1_001017 [Brachionus plicatilis]|uniref:Uncharacterized protein n=1 Tax=Brachionus plicatilis TaxID=10195 RepID=A0A3M7T898_BRAPC|nr:hypothetical protein BpHYR1_001017 [Brachionus plicatilis]